MQCESESETPGDVTLAARQSLLLSSGPSTKCRSEDSSVHVVMFSKLTGIPAGSCYASSTGSMPLLGTLPPHRRHVDRHERFSAPLLHVEAGSCTHTHPPPHPVQRYQQTNKHGSPCVKGKARLHVGAGAPSLYISGYCCRIGRVINTCANTLSNASPQTLLWRR